MRKNLYILSLLLLCSFFCASTAKAQYWCWAYDTSVMTEAGASQGAAADLFGNVYTVGYGRNLLKHKTATGAVEWYYNNLGSADWRSTKICVDYPGNIYALYDSTGTYKIMKVDSFGVRTWTTTALYGGTSLAKTFTINPDNLGNLFICGNFQSTNITAGSTTLLNTAPNNNSFVARYDTAGNLKWIKAVTSAWYNKAYSVAADLSGNVFIAGLCKGDTVRILDTTVVLGIGPNAQGMYVAKCDSDGHLLWITANRHTNSTFSNVSVPLNFHIRVDDAGNAYFAGKFFETDTLGSIPIVYGTTDNTFMAKYSGVDGTVVWAKTGGAGTQLYSMSCSPLGKPYLIFSTSSMTTHFGISTFTLPTGSPTSASTVVGFDSSGNVICGFMLGGSSAEDDAGVATDMQGNAYIHGDFISTINFGDIVKTTTGERYFLAKYTCNCLCGGSLSLFGGNTMCVGGTVTMTSSGSGGTWTSSNPAVATVTPGGVINAVGLGTTTIGYTTGGGCNGTAVITVGSDPTFAATSVCAGLTATLSASTGAGTWTSASPGIASVGSTGVVTGVAGGTALISYSNGPGCLATGIVTVSSVPSIVGSGLCLGSTLTMSSSTSGGTWTSGTGSVATIGSSSGILTGLTTGTALITYSVGAGCTSSTVVTVSPGAPPGGGSLCAGATLSLTGSVPGGTWTSSISGVATVGYSTGLVTGVAGGIVIISYVNPSGCTEITNVTVNATPGPISGKLSICEGFNTLLTCSPTGGTWSSSSSVATIAPGGMYTGVSAGTSVITYMMPGGCYSTTIVTVNALPVITGPTTIAVGSSPTLTGSPAGGSWSSTDTTKVKVNSIGKITGINLGTSTIYYSLPTGCKTSVVVSVVKNTAVTSKTGAGVKPSLFPNPASSEVTVKANQAVFATFIIYNALGQEMVTYDITNPEMKVSVKALPAGQYRAVFKGDGVNETVQFVKW
jgi:uncharacterized protein YjdB